MNKGSLSTVLLGGALLLLAGCSYDTKQGTAKADSRLTDYAGEEGLFEWQFPNKDAEKAWNHYSYSEDRWWGDFPEDLEAPKGNMFNKYPWALGPFNKYEGNPVLAPTPGAWDKGRRDGGVHNGAVVVKDNIFYYVYRGEQPIDIEQDTHINYICDIGIATSTDGVNFTKDTVHSPLFREGEDRKYSYEDVNIVKHKDTYYLYCNQWYWPNQKDHSINGTFLATSKDLLNWEKKGIVFPNADRTHRNAVVLHNPENEAVRVNGKFVMYINDGLMAYSDDLINWESKEVAEENRFPGGEGCVALADYDPENPDNIILFTGGNHTGNFYAVGEVLFNKNNPEKPLSYLPRPMLSANPNIPWENGFAADGSGEMVSAFSDCIFFNALTRHDGKWWMYYGGSEYYTCLATAPVEQ